MSETQLRCPACGRWLGEVSDYARLVCAGCGAEVTFKSRGERKRLEPIALPLDRKHTGR